MNEKMTPSEGLEAVSSLLDKLSDAQGRAKCGYIWTMATLVEDIKKAVVEMEKELMALRKEPEVDVEILQNGTETEEREAQ